MNNKPTLYELSVMSKLSYEDEEKYLPENWEIFKDSREFNDEKSGHFAIVFKNKYNNTFVIANRGTRFKKLIDWFNDSQITLLGESFAAEEAFKYFKYINEVIKGKFGMNFEIYATGHSKGAFESSYITKKIIDTDKQKEYKNYMGSVGFNGPGFGAFRKIENSAQYPHLCIDRVSDVVSCENMSKIGTQTIIPDKAFGTAIISNHSIAHTSDLLNSYRKLGDIEINKESIFEINQQYIDLKIRNSRIEHVEFLQKSSITKDEKIELLKRVNGIRNHAFGNHLVKQYIDKNKQKL